MVMLVQCIIQRLDFTGYGLLIPTCCCLDTGLEVRLLFQDPLPQAKSRLIRGTKLLCFILDKLQNPSEVHAAFQHQQLCRSVVDQMLCLLGCKLPL